MTNQEIINRAKDLIEAELDGIADPTWGSEMLVVWGKDAQDNLMLKTKKELMELLYKNSTTITMALTVGNNLDSDYIDLITVTRNSKPCFITNIKKVLNNLLFTPSESRPIAYIDNKKLFVKPVGDTVPVVVRYIAKPTFVEADESSLPQGWQHLLSSYICAKALEKDKQNDRAAMYMKQFDDGIVIINAKE